MWSIVDLLMTVTLSSFKCPTQSSKTLDQIWNKHVENLPEPNINKRPNLKVTLGQSDPVRIDPRIIRPNPECGGLEQTQTERQHQHWQQHDAPPINKQPPWKRFSVCLKQHIFLLWWWWGRTTSDQSWWRVRLDPLRYLTCWHTDLRPAAIQQDPSRPDRLNITGIQIESSQIGGSNNQVM